MSTDTKKEMTDIPELNKMIEEVKVDRAEEYKQFSKELQQSLYYFTNENPFIGGLLQEMNFKPDYGLPTAGLTYDKKRQHFEIIINPQFFHSMSLDHRIGVLHHEILHFTNAHVFRFGMDGTNKDKEEHKKRNIACLPAGEFVTGVNKNIEDVVIGDVIVGQNRSAKVVATKKHQYTGNTFTVKAMGCLPFTVTDEHPVLVHSRKWRSHYPINLMSSQWKEAKDLEIKFDYVVVPKLKAKKFEKILDLKEFTTETGYRANLKSMTLDNELAYVLGLYVAEGSKLNRHNSGIQFSLHKDEIHLYDLIKKFADKFNYNTRFKITDNNLKVDFSSTILCKAFEKWCGRGAYNKQIPDFILYNEDTTVLQSFLDGYIEGDGHYGKKSIKAGTVSKKLALELQLAYARLGYFASIRQCNRGERIIRGKTLKPYTIFEVEIHAKKVSTRDFGNGELNSLSYRWKEFEDYIAVPITSIEKKAFEGTVYNLRTENHEFAVNNVVTHNCDMAINQYIRTLPENCVDVKYFETDDGNPFPKFATAEVYLELLKDNPNAMKKAGENMEKAGVKSPGSGEAFGDGQTLDQHDWESLSDDEKKQMAEEMRKMIKRTMEKTSYDKSSLPDAIKDLIEEMTTFLNKMNYKQILMSAIKKSVSFTDRAATWKRPNKRYGTVAKGTTLAKLPTLWELVDTSGSISVKELNEFLTVVDGFLKAGSRKCMIGFWHTSMYKLKKYKLGNKIKEEEIESGGTDMTDTVEKVNKGQPDLAIILTDGYYSSNVNPEVQTIIVISENGTMDHPLKNHPMVKTISMKGLK